VFPDGDRMRKKLSLVLYLLLVELVAIYLVVVPVYAFQVSQSTTGWVRTLNTSGASAMFAASRPAQLSAVASAASVGGASLAIRMVSGLGWAGLGVTAGLLLYQAFYSSTDLEAVRMAAQPAGTFRIPTAVSGVQITAHAECPGGATCSVGSDQTVTTFISNFCGNGIDSTMLGPGWTLSSTSSAGGCPGINAHWNHAPSVPSSKGVELPGPIPTAGEINSYLSTLPASNPLSIESHTAVAGVDTTTQTADQVVIQPVPSSQVTMQVVPATTSRASLWVRPMARGVIEFLNHYILTHALPSSSLRKYYYGTVGIQWSARLGQ
jgi:hypothetical protein